MTNMPFDQNFFFDVELSLAGASLTGTPVLVGTLTNYPAVIMFKNQTSVPIFLADNTGTTNGTTMAIGEEIIMDCRANHGSARNAGWAIGTSFFATGAAGTGNVKITVIPMR